MRLPTWTQVALWFAYGLVALVPVALLAFDALAGADSAAAMATLWSPDPWRLLGRSLTIAAGAATLALLLGVLPALVCERTDLRGRSWWRAMLITPLLIPPFMHALVWERLLAPRGPVDAWLGLQIPRCIPTPVSPGCSPCPISRSSCCSSSQD